MGAWARLAAVAVACVAIAGPVQAGQGDNAQSPPDVRPLAERAKAILEAHCPDCRAAIAQTVSPQWGTPQSGALDLAALADMPGLVIPRRPDASRIYLRMLAEDSTDAASPTAAEIETVRDWIESLPPRDEACRDRAPISAAGVEDLIDRWLASVGLTEADDTRFLSLVHLWNACVPAEQLRQYRDAATALLVAHAREKTALEIETLGDESAILAYRPSELRSAPPAGPVDVGGIDATPADWLAVEFLANASADALDPSIAEAVAGLARAWMRDVDLARAAAERGTTTLALANRLTAVDGDLALDARRLLQGVLSRAAWSRLQRVLDGESVSGSPERRNDASEIDVLVWTDKPVYRPGDLATINVSVSRACHLTLIDIDHEGRAIVLFPNELEPDNLVAPAVTIRVAGNDAGYQLRFERTGEEQIVAICQRASRRLAGVDYDYEKQRFQSLGDWREFLRTAAERERAIDEREKAEVERRRRRRGNGAAEPEPAPIDAAGGPVEGRAAATVRIEPASEPQ